MFKIDSELIGKIKGALKQKQLAPAAGNLVFDCFGCSGSCSGSCKGSCWHSCLADCGTTCAGKNSN